MIRRILAPCLFGAALVAMTYAVPTDGFAQQKGKYKAKEPKLPDGTKAERDLAYGERGVRNKLDLFVPKSDKPLPLVIWIHGGGWQGGSKNGVDRIMFLLDKGYAVAGINYRLTDAAPFPAQIEDCKAAVRFLRANAKKYNLDPDRFGVWGLSAGGHLVALMGTSGDVKELEGDGPNRDVSSRVQAVCDWFGPADFNLYKLTPDKDTPTTAMGKLFGGKLSEKKELARKASPVTYATADDPPFLIMQGDKDPLVPLDQSQSLEAALKKANVPVELVVLKGVGHGGPEFMTPEKLEKVTAFFDKHLKK